MHCVTMNVYRAECVTELESNNSEPERARAHLCERTRALNGQKHAGNSVNKTLKYPAMVERANTASASSQEIRAKNDGGMGVDFQSLIKCRKISTAKKN